MMGYKIITAATLSELEDLVIGFLEDSRDEWLPCGNPVHDDSTGTWAQALYRP